jgi:TRAP transporter TAXI family solute receptor
MASWRRRFVILSIAVTALVGFASWSFLARWAPPRTVTLATGPEGSSLAALGERYRAILARSGVEVRLVKTAGEAENLALLRDPRSRVSAAFLISGLPGAEEATGLESLGTIAYEPFWLFERSAGKSLTVEGLSGRRISLGLGGSGTRAMARKLIELAGIDTRSAKLVELPPMEAAEGLLRGQLDAVALVTDWEAPAVRRLVASPEISVVSLRRADAFVALDPKLSKLLLPAGVGDFNRNRPPADVVLIAPKASLVVRDDLHEAIQFLLVDAASRIHSRAGIFHLAGAFPAAEAIDFPLSDEAARFFRSGRPLLHRYLPFWAAVRAERILLLLIPVLGILVPLTRVVPSAYRALMERRIVVLYGELKLVETELETAAEEEARTALLKRLDDLDRRASCLRVPLQFSQMRYTLKDHIGLVRHRLSSGA